MPRVSHSASIDLWRDPSSTERFIKGRAALYAILRALDVGPGDTVVLPGFTCFVVPAAVVYTGATPKFYDIDPRTLQGSATKAVGECLTSTRALLIQHNFGAACDLDQLPEFCRTRGIALIEDCAHAIGASRRGIPVGHLGDAAFASLQWSKPITTGLGGIAVASSEELRQSLREVVATEFTEPSRTKSAYLFALSWLYRNLYRPTWYWLVRGLYHRASRVGLLQGSSLHEEFVIPRMPSSYRETFGRLRMGSLDAALAELPATIARRRRVHQIYARHFQNQRTWMPATEGPGDVNTALRYPLLVENREELVRAAQRERVELGDWFNAPLHPLQCDAQAFGYETGQCPVAELAAQRIVNLPTHPHLDDREIQRIIAFLDKRAATTSLQAWTDMTASLVPSDSTSTH